MHFCDFWHVTFSPAEVLDRTKQQRMKTRAGYNTNRPIYIYIYIHTYTYIERIYIYIYISYHVYIYIYMYYVFIYIYIERERYTHTYTELKRVSKTRMCASSKTILEFLSCYVGALLTIANEND